MLVEEIISSNKSIVIKPSGGLGNRIISLIGGTFLSQILNCKAYVYWHPCHLCDCEYEDIFIKDSAVLLTQQEYHTLDNYIDTTLIRPVLKTSDTLFKRYNKNSLHIELVNKDTLLQNHIIAYKGCILPTFITFEDIINILGIFRFKKEIYELAYDFIIKNNINNNDRGYHGRFTDCYNRDKKYNELNTTNKLTLFNTITDNKNTRYFVCSCDRNLEFELNIFNNVIFRPKVNYPEFYTSYNNMCDTAPVNTLIRKDYLINSDTLFPLNYISKDAVMEGIIDMLILSRTNMVKAISSTFWDLANWYSHIYIGKHSIKAGSKIISI